MTDAATSSEQEQEEVRRVLENRFLEARTAGLTLDQADEFSRNGIDIGQLRKLVAAGATASTIAEIVL